MKSQSSLASALATFSESHLYALRSAIDRSANTAPGLLAWLEHAIGWEIDRRAAFEYSLQGPRAAIDDSEVEPSLLALATLAAQFERDQQTVGIAEFFTLVATILRAEIERPESIQ